MRCAGNRSQAGQEGGADLACQLSMDGFDQPLEYVAILEAAGFDHC
jgi:hypothetical protein